MTRKKTKKRTLRMHLTEKRIAALAPPDRGACKLYDANVPALGLKLLPSGKKNFFWFRNVPAVEFTGESKSTWLTIGEWPSVSLESARAKAEEYNVLLANWKKDGCRRPSPFRAPSAGMTFGELVEDYALRHLRAHAKRPDRAERELRYGVNKHLSTWRDRPLSAVAWEDVRDVHARLGRTGKRYAANGIVELIGRLFRFAARTRSWVGENPAEGIDRFHEESRARYLTPDELGRLGTALRAQANPDLSDYIGLALWTGARRGDVLGMRWENVSLPDNAWTVPNPKSRRPYTVPLTPEAIAILRRRGRKRKGAAPWVFPSHGKTGHVVDMKRAWKALLKKAKITGVRQHDLRRTQGSFSAAAGVPLQVIGKSLGHASVGSTEIYARLELDPVRAAMTATNRVLAAAMRQKPKQLPATG